MLGLQVLLTSYRNSCCVGFIPPCVNVNHLQSVNKDEHGNATYWHIK